MDKPRPGDAVLGNNQTPNTPFNALVLGGIKGAKQRLTSNSFAVKLEGLCSALKYNEQGLILVHEFIQALNQPLYSVYRPPVVKIYIDTDDAATTQ
ncbi:hypothetical protein RIVM261_038590 [Rivularia sp. IAM M-261]|nr:hypothetical protein CAL7716_077630 [Calothrix sp. PCC 7716]GJD18903.1 hypothetical protein RIVM261_038590 [Rivularia sp. IAM M-261]